MHPIMLFALDAMALGWPHPSGIRTILRELVPALARSLEGDRLLLWQNDRRASSRPIDFHAPGVLHRASRIPPRILQGLWRKLDWPPVEAFTGPVDVFHSLQGRLPASRRAKLVLALNDFRHRRLPHLYPGERWYPREIARADHFIAISETTRREAMELLQIPPARITTIHLGPPALRLPGPEEGRRALERFGLTGAPYLLCPSSSDRRKNPGAAVDAFRLLGQRRDVPHRLAVVGGVPPGEEESLRRRGAGAVIFTGVVPDEDYACLLAGAEAAVHPSLCEGFGFPVLEAFRAGVPQAVAGGTALPEVAGEAALTFDAREPETLAAAMERLIEDPELRRRLADAGRRRLEDFSWERNARETLALHRRLAAGERSPVFRNVPAGAW